MEKLNVGDIAIIDLHRLSFPKKIEVIEETETTYLLIDLDFERGGQFIIDDNDLPPKKIKEVFDDFKKCQTTLVQNYSESRVEHICAKFRITKEEFDNTYKVIELISTLKQREQDVANLLKTMQ